MKKIVLFILIVLVFSEFIFSQNFTKEEKQVQILFDKLFFATNDGTKDSLNTIILKEFEEILNSNKYSSVNLKTIKNISALKSEDEKVEIITWAIQYSNNTYKFYGFVKYYSKARDKYFTELLFDNIDLDESNMSSSFKSDNWYGSVYYEIVYKNYKGDKQYVIFGWDGNDQFTNKKILDVIWIEDQENLVFGKQIFNTGNQLKSRFIFEYGERVSMILNYNPELKMIIWDHLSPSKQELKGHYQYYGPDLSYDGLVFEKGIWKLISNIDLTDNGRK